MLGLTFRAELPPIVAAELDSLIARLQPLLGTPGPGTSGTDLTAILGRLAAIDAILAALTVGTGTGGFMGARGPRGERGEDGRSIPGSQGLRGVAGVAGQPGRNGEDGQRGPVFVLPCSPGSKEFTTTTTGNIDDLDFGNAAIIRMNNASLATLRGLRAGASGQVVGIVSIGAGQVDLAHQDAGSTEQYRLLNFVTSGTTPLAAGSGAAFYQYDGTTARWRLVSHVQGAWITPAFAAGDYTASGGGTWTVGSGDVETFKYLIDGRQMCCVWSINTTTVAGAPVTLQRVIPGSVTSGATLYAAMPVSDDGTGGIGKSQVAASGTTLFFYKDQPGTAWANATNTTIVQGEIAFELT